MQFEYPDIYKFVPVVMTSCCLLLATGCSSNDDNPASNETSTPNASPANPESNPFADALAGSWLAPCDPSSSGGSSQLEVAVTGTTMVMTEREYTDAACQTPATPAVFENTLSLAFPGGTTVTTLGTATNIDATPESATVDGQPPSAQEQANIPTGTIYSILLIVDDKLYFGDDTDDFDGSTVDKRHQSLEENVEEVLIRQ